MRAGTKIGGKGAPAPHFTSEALGRGSFAKIQRWPGAGAAVEGPEGAGRRLQGLVVRAGEAHGDWVGPGSGQAEGDPIWTQSTPR